MLLYYCYSYYHVQSVSLIAIIGVGQTQFPPPYTNIEYCHDKILSTPDKKTENAGQVQQGGGSGRFQQKKRWNPSHRHDSPASTLTPDRSCRPWTPPAFQAFQSRPTSFGYCFLIQPHKKCSWNLSVKTHTLCIFPFFENILYFFTVSISYFPLLINSIYERSTFFCIQLSLSLTVLPIFYWM